MSGTTVAATTENGMRTKSTESASTFGQTVASMTVSGVTIICTDAASTPGKMEENTREST